MFGNAPRALWEKWAAPDELNRIELACRALLASPLEGKTVLLKPVSGRSSIRACVSAMACRKPARTDRFVARSRFEHEDIDVVVLSHLHSIMPVACWRHGAKGVSRNCCSPMRPMWSVRSIGSAPCSKPKQDQERHSVGWRAVWWSGHAVTHPWGLDGAIHGACPPTPPPPLTGGRWLLVGADRWSAHLSDIDIQMGSNAIAVQRALPPFD